MTLIGARKGVASDSRITARLQAAASFDRGNPSSPRLAGWLIASRDGNPSWRRGTRLTSSGQAHYGRPGTGFEQAAPEGSGGVGDDCGDWPGAHNGTVMLMKLFLRTLVLAGGVSLARAGWPPDIAEPVRVIRAVGPEGQGNAAASVAWKALTAGNAATLRPLLEAMDGANDYALNWLRAAVDAIAGRELAAGRPLPLPDLKQFLRETEHNPRARRLAFELVARVDPATADPLLAGMLDDPSLELRRDAVQQLIDQAEQALACTNSAAASQRLQAALGSAREVAQIERIASKLQGLGQPVDLQKHFGFLTEWKVIGPFDNTGNQGFETAFPPELKIDLAAEYDGKKGKVRWQEYVTKHKYGMVDMNQPCGKLKEVTAYATTDFYSDRARPVELRLGGKNSWRVWLNGRLLFAHDEYHTNTEIDQYRMPTELQPGRNTILVKVCQNEEIADWTGEWEFQLRVTDALGTPIISASPPRSADDGKPAGHQATRD